MDRNAIVFDVVQELNFNELHEFIELLYTSRNIYKTIRKYRCEYDKTPLWRRVCVFDVFDELMYPKGEIREIYCSSYFPFYHVLGKCLLIDSRSSYREFCRRYIHEHGSSISSSKLIEKDDEQKLIKFIENHPIFRDHYHKDLNIRHGGLLAIPFSTKPDRCNSRQFAYFLFLSICVLIFFIWSHNI